MFSGLSFDINKFISKYNSSNSVSYIETKAQ